MEQFKPLGRRDIFGIVLPGAIVVFACAYTIFGVLVLLGLKSWIANLLGQEFLLSLVLFVAAYLVGSLLRLFAADDVDNQSSDYLKEAWQQEHQAEITSGDISELDYKERQRQLANSSDPVEVPVEFDDWLWRVEKFPYPVWQKRKWQAHGLKEVLEFFQDNHKSSMWPENGTLQDFPSPTTFFNYCKLVVISSGGGLADEVDMAESLTRFFAGTVAALRLSAWLLGAALVTQVLLTAAWFFASSQGITFTLAEWKFQGFYSAATIALMFAMQRMTRQIVIRFRKVRLKEAGTVYHAFYLHQIHPENDETGVFEIQIGSAQGTAYFY
jgi:hypothetical protein